MPPDQDDVAAIRGLQQALADAGVPTVLGGSALLASLGLTTRVRDWDLVTDAEPDLVRAALIRLGVDFREGRPTELFRSAAALCFDLRGRQVDLIVRFALRTPGGTVRIPARPGGAWRGLEMARAQDWALAYALMGRAEKAAALERADPLAGGSVD